MPVSSSLRGVCDDFQPASIHEVMMAVWLVSLRLVPVSCHHHKRPISSATKFGHCAVGCSLFELLDVLRYGVIGISTATAGAICINLDLVPTLVRIVLLRP